MSLLLAAMILVAEPTFTSLAGVHFRCEESGGTRAVVQIIAASGALNEAPGQEGIAHFLEHLLLRPLNMDDSNGSTTFDYTHYFRAVGRTELSTAAVELVRAVRSLSVSPEDFERERAVVLRELADRGDDYYVPDQIFADTMFDRSVGGTKASLRALTMENVRAFHAEHYRKGNIAVVITSAPDCRSLMTFLAPELDRYPPGAFVPRPREPTPAMSPHFFRTVFPGLFAAGFYWYEEDMIGEIALLIAAKHLEQQALAELRATRGLTYSPQARVERMGGGGKLTLSVTTDAKAGDVADWYEGAVAELRNSPTPLKSASRAVRVVSEELERDAVRAALSVIRGESAPLSVILALDDATLHEALERVLAPERAFGPSKRSLTTVISMFVIFGGAVLLMGYIAWKMVRG